MSNLREKYYELIGDWRTPLNFNREKLLIKLQYKSILVLTRRKNRIASVNSSKLICIKLTMEYFSQLVTMIN